jgi:hypothetical protein
MTKLEKDEKDIFTLKGIVEIIVKDKDGNIKYHYKEKNVVTYASLGTIIRLLFEGLTDTKFGYLAIGTGTTSETPNDTALVSEIARKSATITQTTVIQPNDTALLEAEFSSADGLSGTSDVSETGIFNASYGGTMLARKTFTPVSINWDARDIFIIKYYIIAKIVT